ncbi:hypothetical protein [Neptuniibacter sp. QD37_11]|uniref:hypothetical protein n=1 Tax=Neptuniibacter sp. QD37_11 TaxID=3398209 RepID=UPI0039F52D27
MQSPKFELTEIVHFLKLGKLASAQVLGRQVTEYHEDAQLLDVVIHGDPGVIYITKEGVLSEDKVFDSIESLIISELKPLAEKGLNKEISSKLEELLPSPEVKVAYSISMELQAINHCCDVIYYTEHGWSYPVEEEINVES